MKPIEVTEGRLIAASPLLWPRVLYRDLAVESRVARAIDLAHAARATAETTSWTGPSRVHPARVIRTAEAETSRRFYIYRHDGHVVRVVALAEELGSVHLLDPVGFRGMSLESHRPLTIW